MRGQQTQGSKRGQRKERGEPLAVEILKVGRIGASWGGLRNLFGIVERALDDAGQGQND